MKATAILGDYAPEVITDPDDIARIQAGLDRAREINSVRMIKGEFLRQSDVAYKCLCCTPAVRVITTPDPDGREQYTCPATKITMRVMECRPLPRTNPRTGETEYIPTPTYAAGYIRLKG
jgi:hypothetical protein